MFNADGIVIADKAQSADDVLPIEQIVAVADAAEDPGAVCFVCIALRVERAVLAMLYLSRRVSLRVRGRLRRRRARG